MTGDIILLNRKKGGWFSSCQRFFTKMPYTHSTFSVGNILGFESVLSADEKIVIEPVGRYYEEKETDIEIYRIKRNVMPIGFERTLENAIEAMYYKYANTYYGFGQVSWFVYRWFMESILKKNAKKKENPFKSGIICSELVYLYLEQVCKVLNKCYPKKDSRRFSVLLPLQIDLNKFNRDTIHAGDIANILKNNNNIWERIA